MTQEEIQERNKQIAIMLGSEKKNDGQFDYWIYDHLGYDTMKISGACWVSGNFEFHSDWNWLMEAVEFIEREGYSTQISHGYTISNYGSDHCEINTIDNALLYYDDVEKSIVSILDKSKKQTVFTAVSNFAKLYNQTKL